MRSLSIFTTPIPGPGPRPDGGDDLAFPCGGYGCAPRCMSMAVPHCRVTLFRFPKFAFFTEHRCFLLEKGSEVQISRKTDFCPNARQVSQIDCSGTMGTILYSPLNSTVDSLWPPILMDFHSLPSVTAPGIHRVALRCCLLGVLKGSSLKEAWGGGGPITRLTTLFFTYRGQNGV